MRRFARSVVVDTGFWYALCDPGDGLHKEAGAKAHYLDEMNVLIPWPCLYETFRTQFARKRPAVQRLETLLRKPHVELLDDAPYRDPGLDDAIRSGIAGKRPISLVDMVIRLILDDTGVRTDCLLTFNVPDFQDVCRRRGIQIL